jgi:predicted RNA binding protein YcfA (HicA-like mRNA interferase family)
LSRLPAVSGREVVAALGRLGFAAVRIRGSHHFLRHADGRATVVPVHPGEDLGRGIMAKILRDTKISEEHLREAL